jgi:hypothetical protein
MTSQPGNCFQPAGLVMKHGRRKRFRKLISGMPVAKLERCAARAVHRRPPENGAGGPG